eukprot:10108312-Lingulodinium_polyedra.AAC.1
MAMLRKVADTIFSGWCQSKVVEDGNKVVRDEETRAVTNKSSLKPARQWDTLRSREVIAGHQRQELDPQPGAAEDASQQEAPKVGEGLFTARGHAAPGIGRHPPPQTAIGLSGHRRIPQGVPCP